MVVAIGLAALMLAVSGTARTSGYLRDKTLAQWMALNRLSEVRLNLTKFGQNTDTGEINIANMKRVVVRVYAGDAKTKGNPLAESTGFLGSAIATPGSSNSADWTVGSTLAPPPGNTAAPGTPGATPIGSTPVPPNDNGQTPAPTP